MPGSVDERDQLDVVLREGRLLGAREQSLARRVRRRSAGVRRHADAEQRRGGVASSTRRSATSSATGPMEGLSINLQGTNLTDEPFALTQVDTPSMDLIKYQKYGAIYSLALTYRF